MQKSLAVAIVVAAGILAAALFYHGRKLAAVSHRLEMMEQRTGSLDNRLDKFSKELPGLFEQAGNGAGRQVLHGMVDEVLQTPLNWLRPALPEGATNAPTKLVSPVWSRSASEPGAALVRFDIREPIVTIEILPNVREVSGIRWQAGGGGEQEALQTNTMPSTVPSGARPRGVATN